MDVTLEVPTGPAPTMPPSLVQQQHTPIEEGIEDMGPYLIVDEIGAEQEDCRAVVESIRIKDFGIGLELDDRQREIADKQREREGRGLQRLSKELYSKDTHFVLELIQNADDNSYDVSCVYVLNNEVGFTESNVRAICDVGKSTKGSHRVGYIGHKGIGFKSVFRVTDTPEIHSHGYHIRFDAKSDAIGYILPHWIEERDGEATHIGKGYIHVHVRIIDMYGSEQKKLHVPYQFNGSSTLDRFKKSGKSTLRRRTRLD